MSNPFGGQPRDTQNLFGQPSTSFGQAFSTTPQTAFGVQPAKTVPSTDGASSGTSTNLFASATASLGTGVFGKTSTSPGNFGFGGANLFSQGKSEANSNSAATTPNLFAQFSASTAGNTSSSSAFTGGSVFGGAKLFSSSSTSAKGSKSTPAASLFTADPSFTASKGATSAESLESGLNKDNVQKTLFSNPVSSERQGIFGATSTSGPSSVKSAGLFGKESQPPPYDTKLFQGKKDHEESEKKSIFPVQVSETDTTALTSAQGGEKVLFGKPQKETGETISPRRRPLIKRDREQTGSGSSAARSIFSKAVSSATGQPDIAKEIQDELQSGESRSGRNLARKTPQKSSQRRLSRMLSTGEEVSSKIALVCKDVPASINNVMQLRKHFNKFGNVTKVFPSPAKRSATVHFKTHAGDHVFKRTKSLVQDSKKAGCSARIVLREILRFPSYKLQVDSKILHPKLVRENEEIQSNSKWRRVTMSKTLRVDVQAGKSSGVRSIVLVFPSMEDHDPSCITQAASVSFPVDGDVINFIQNSVSEGVRSVDEMQRHLKHFLKEKFPDTKLPSRLDRSFHPSKTDIKNAMYRAIIRNRLSNIDQENLNLRLDQWKKERPGDHFYFRQHELSDSAVSDTANCNEEDEVRVTENAGPTISKLLFVHQSTEQKQVLQIYGNELCLLDATYRTTRYSLPLFFIGVKTNVGYMVVASFITQDETTASIIEALSILKQWNPNWQNPHSFMTDFCQEEITAVESVFPGCEVYICDFHREQAWTRWLRNRDHGVQQQHEEILCCLRKIARSSTVQNFQNAVQNLQDTDIWRANKRLSHWFGHTWLPCAERWVWAFRKERFLVNVNTNNGIERQNETFKHTYLEKRRNKTLSQMVQILVEEYVPDQYFRYVNHNLKCLSSHRQYSASIPSFLHDRPREFITSCMERYCLAQQIPRSAIQNKSGVSNYLYDVSSHTSSTTSPDGSIHVHSVNLGDNINFPTCTCYYWQHHYVPCKHMLAVILKVDGLSWNSLSSLYRKSPYLNIDFDVVTATNTKPDENLPAYDDDDGEVGEIHSATTALCLPVPKNISRSLAAQCREKLKHIMSLTYLMQDSVALSNLDKSLTLLQDEVEEVLPKESGLILEKHITTCSKTVRKEASSKCRTVEVDSQKPRPKNRLKLPNRKQHHPFAGRTGEKADVMKSQYLWRLPLSVNDKSTSGSACVINDGLPELIVNIKSTSIPQNNINEAQVSNTSGEAQKDDLKACHVVYVGESKSVPVEKYKKRKLSSDIEFRILSGAMLEDPEINLAQCVLHKQFPHIQGLEDTVLGPVRQFSVFSGKFVQVLHDGEIHWICVSNIGCEKANMVKYFDSFNKRGLIKSEVENLIASFMHTEGPEIYVSVSSVQQQTNQTDCGLFAIAFATALLHGQDPSCIQFDVTRLRPHFLACLQTESFTPFPYNLADKRTSEPKAICLVIELFCTCRMPWHASDKKDPLLWMAECDCCQKWYHRKCAEIPLDVFTNGRFWECKACL